MARVGRWLGDGDVWAPVIDMAGGGASRADIESVRRAVRKLAADGLVELRHQPPADKDVPRHYQLAARLDVESPFRRCQDATLSAVRAAVGVDLDALLPSWELALSAEHKSPQTVKSYGDGVRRCLRWCERTGTPADLSRGSVAGYVGDLLENGAQATTARARQLAVRRFSAWLVEEGEVAIDPLLDIKAPKLDAKVIEPLSDDQLKALLKACAGPNMCDRRDEAGPAPTCL